MLKGKLFETGRLKFDKWLFGPEEFSGISRNRPLVLWAMRGIDKYSRVFVPSEISYKLLKDF